MTVTVNQSAKGAALASTVQQIGLVVGTVATIAGAAPAGTLIKAATLATSDPFATALTALATLGIGLFGVVKSIFKHKEKVTLAAAAPDSVAVVTSK